jgi:tetratricopeptide (TPR) repeat protein
MPTPPGRGPLTPAAALAGLLAATGLDLRFLPGDLKERAELWRERIAGERALLVLDNAASSAQVAPLLPGGDCLVLVTSRRHLGDLPGVVAPVLLGALPAGEAAAMFTRLAPRAAADPAGVAEVVELAGCLPLAVSLLARVFVRHPSWTLADLAADTRAGLLTLTAETSSIAAAFELSYRHLDPARRRFFDLLGLHPGATTDRYAAAALAGASVAQAGELLDALYGEGLLTETGYRRYGMHDLLRRYARDHAAQAPAGKSQQALGRLLDYYQHTAARANALITRWTRPGPPPAAPAGLPAGPGLASEDQALAWARADRAALLACLDHATRTGQHARVIALTAALAGLLERDGPWTDAVTRHTTALRAAQHLSDQPGQANALHELGYVRGLTNDCRGAARDLAQALGTFRALGDQLGQANALILLGNAQRITGDHLSAAQAIEQALRIYRDLGDQLGQANALNYLGRLRWETGDYPGAAQILELALRIFRDLGDQSGQADALYDLGTVRRLTGDYPGAVQAQEQALATSRDLGDETGQACALHELGNVRRLTGDYPGAVQALEQALSTVRDLGSRHHEAEMLNDRGTLHRASGELTRAGDCHQQALDLARALSSPRAEAHALAGLGRCALDTGHTTQAETLLRNALKIFQRIGAAEAPGLLAELNTLTSPRPRR